MVSFNVGGGASVNVGGMSFGGDASASGGVDFGAALSQLGQAAIDVANTVTTGASNAAGAVQGSAEKIADGARSAVDSVAGGAKDVFGRVSGFLGEAASHIPKFSLGDLVGKIALPHTPPPPDIKLAGGVGLAARVAGGLGIDFQGSGFAEVGASGGSVRADGSFTLRSGSVTSEDRGEISSALRAVLSLGGSVENIRGRLGFDLAAKCADFPLLSQLIAGLPSGLDILSAARREVGGGFQHLKDFFGSLVDKLPNLSGRVDIRGDINIRGNAEVLVPRGPVILGPPPNENIPGRTPAPPPKSGETDMTRILKDPNLSFEDKIFMFCLAIAKKQEDNIKAMMEGWKTAKAAAQADGTYDGAKSGQADAKGGADGTGSSGGGGMGLPFLPDLSGAGSMVGKIVGMAQHLGSGVLKVAGATAPLWVPALCTVASAALSGTGVGAIAAPFIEVLGSTGGTLAVGAACGIGSVALDKIPLNKLAESATNSITGMFSGGGTASASGSASVSGSGGMDLMGSLTGMLGIGGGAGGGGVDLMGTLTGMLSGGGEGGGNPLSGVMGMVGSLFGGEGGGLGGLASGLLSGGGAESAGGLISTAASMLGGVVDGAGGSGAGSAISSLGEMAAGLVSSGAAGEMLKGATSVIGGVAGGVASAQQKPGCMGPIPAPKNGVPVPSKTEARDGNGELVADAKDKDSENMFMQKLTHEQQELSKTYDLLSNMMKAMHDTQMTSIRNMH